MTKATSIGYVLFAVLLAVGLSVPAAAVSPAGSAAPDDATAATAATVQETTTENNSSVNVTVGQQLSTVIDASSEEVQTDFENTAFELAVEGASEEARAEAIADRAEELRERAEDIREDYEAATEAYEAGEISKSTYAQRLASLNARATNLLESYEQLRQRARTVSALELEAAGVNQSALRTSIDNLSSVSGTGAAALFRQFTGQSQGEIELETADGLSVEITSEDGDQSREIERPRDADTSVTVNQSAALDAARAALSTPANGTWTLTEASLNQEEGTYEFAFVLRDAPTRTGEAEVGVDGSSGEVFSLEEEIETRDAEDAEEAEEAEDGELALLVTDGTPAPNATVTLAVRANGAPAENVTVYLNEAAVGTTDANGTVTVTLPERGEAKLTARQGDAEGELEFEFEDEADEAGDVFRQLTVDTSLANDTVSVTVFYNGSGVANATVYANGDAVGTTDADGTVTFTIDANATEELELEVVKGEFEAELEYTVENGSLTLTEAAHEGDGDKADAEEDDRDEAEEDDADADDGEATETPEEETEDEDSDEEETETPEEETEDDDDDDDDEEETETPEEETDDDEDDDSY